MDPQVIWPPSIVSKISTKHGLTTAEVEEVLLDDTLPTRTSRSSGRPCKFGWTSTGKHIIAIWAELDGDPNRIVPVSAYPVPPP
jgi:uncharacterized DUF497 family protein